MADEQMPIYMRLLLISQNWEAETVSISPEDAKELLAALDVVRAMRNATNVSEESPKRSGKI